MEEHKKRISQLTSFRTITVITISVVLWSSYSIMTSGEFVFSPTMGGFNFFLEAFEFPLKCLAAYIPTIGLIGLNHRSLQTNKQLEETERHNTFNNYYSHINELEKYVGKLVERGLFSDIDVRSVHATLFPKAQQGNYRVDITSASSLHKDFLIVCREAKMLLTAEHISDHDEEQFCHTAGILELKLINATGSNHSEKVEEYLSGAFDKFSGSQLLGHCLYELSRLLKNHFLLMCFDTSMTDIELKNTHNIFDLFIEAHLNSLGEIPLFEQEQSKTYGVDSQSLINHVDHMEKYIDKYLSRVQMVLEGVQ